MSETSYETCYRADWMSDDQWACARLLADLYGGFHHVPTNAIRQFGKGISISHYRFHLATFDYDQLTRLVVLAHDRCIRAEVEGGGPGQLKIILHKRHHREGRMNERHPTLEDNVASIRRGMP